MTLVLRCPACGESGSKGASFCRRCGGQLELCAGGDQPEELTDGRARASAEDARRLLRDLWWLAGGPVLLSVAYNIWTRLAGDSAAGDVTVVCLMAAIALSGAVMNWPVVRQSLRWPGVRGLALTLLVAVVTAPTVVGLFWIFERLGFRFFAGYLAPYRQDGWPLWVGFAATALVTPLSEELLFRGLIQPKLERFMAPNEALIVQAALFSAAHLSPVILLTHFLLGLAAGFVRRKTQSLLPSVLLHAAWNAWVLSGA